MLFVQNVAQMTIIFDKPPHRNKTRKEISSRFLERNVFRFWKDQRHSHLNVMLKRSVGRDKGSNDLLLIRPHLPTLVTNSGERKTPPWTSTALFHYNLINFHIHAAALFAPRSIKRIILIWLLKSKRIPRAEASSKNGFVAQ